MKKVWKLGYKIFKFILKEIQYYQVDKFWYFNSLWSENLLWVIFNVLIEIEIEENEYFGL